MESMFATFFAKFFQLQLVLPEFFLVFVGIIIDISANLAFKFDKIILWHIRSLQFNFYPRSHGGADCDWLYQLSFDFDRFVFLNSLN